MDDLIQVKEFLDHGDYVALPVGNMYMLYRIIHNQLSGETTFEDEGLVTLTGAHNTVRRGAHSATVNEEKK